MSADAHASEHGHAHGEHQHDHADHADHDHDDGWLARLRHVIAPHSHDSAVAVDSALEASDRGMRALFVRCSATRCTTSPTR
jgi:hypothetical protein